MCCGTAGLLVRQTRKHILILPPCHFPRPNPISTQVYLELPDGSTAPLPITQSMTGAAVTGYAAALLGVPAGDVLVTRDSMGAGKLQEGRLIEQFVGPGDRLNVVKYDRSAQGVAVYPASLAACNLHRFLESAPSLTQPSLLCMQAKRTFL